jgi:N-sulfoglucosamine sulfohydrolase
MSSPFRRLLFLALPFILCGSLHAANAKPNILIITTDDMSCDSVGAFGCKLKDTTPHMDRLAAQSMRFNQAHTVVGNCMPSRNVMWSGRYPHNNRIEGFRALTKEETNYPVMGDLMKAGGWFTGIRHKVSHSTPYSPFPWDADLDKDADGRKLHTKDAPSYGTTLTQGITAAKQAGKPFCLMLNVADPHKPFYAEGNRGDTVPDEHVPSKVFTPEAVPVPGFLPDDPVVRKELAHYYSSVRRADDAVGAILDALKSSGEDERTVIIFLSDHGMPLPFSKTQLYHHSTRTPLMIRWPGITKPGAVDNEHLVSSVDLLPTLLDIAGLEHPTGFDGQSFAPILRGEKQPGRTMVFKEHNENSGGQNTPMRAVQTKDWLYVFSPWSNGTRVMSGATAGTPTCRQMRVLAKTSREIAARIDLFDHRVPEEAYEVAYDPDALTNLINKPESAVQVATLEKAMEEWMVRTKDPLLEVFLKRDDAAFREAFISKEEAESTPRKRNRAKAKGKANASTSSPGSTSPATSPPSATSKKANLISLQLPETVTAGEKVAVKLLHTLPADLGERAIQVTLKGATGERIERKEIKVSGTGEAEVTFAIPASLAGKKASFAGLVGTTIKDTLQHFQSKPIPVK